MTLDKDRKRIIRNRMKDTGESYTTARRHVLARAAKTSRPRPAATQGASANIDYRAIAGQSNESIQRQTGHDWQEWIRLLDGEGAAAMTHTEIARIVHGKYGVRDWWAQTVTVGYERLKGRRERGQRIGGTYEVSKSKTFNVPVTMLFEAWADAARRRRWLDDVDVTVRKATAPKTIRLQWPDGTIVAAWFMSKGAGKSNISLAHMKLPSKAALEQGKSDWTARLDALSRVLGDQKR